MTDPEPVRTWRTYADDEWARYAVDPLGVDEEPWTPPEDPLAPARGCLFAATITVLAGLAVLLVVAAWGAFRG